MEMTGYKLDKGSSRRLFFPKEEVPGLPSDVSIDVIKRMGVTSYQGVISGNTAARDAVKEGDTSVYTNAGSFEPSPELVSYIQKIHDQNGNPIIDLSRFEKELAELFSR